MAKNSDSSRRFLTALLTCFLLTGLAVAFVDRPVSSWSYATFHGERFFVWLTWIVEPVPWIAVAGLAICGVRAAFGWRPGEHCWKFIVACLCVAVAITAKEQFKIAFGRTWPETWTHNNPSWIKDGAFGLHPFHGGDGWKSFPSGHTTLITSVAVFLWREVRPLRAFAVAIVALAVIGLIGTDFHFVSDMIAGAYLGAACTAGVLAVFRPRLSGGPSLH